MKKPAIAPKRPLLLYFGATYLIFWILLACTGLAMQLKAPALVLYLLPVVAAWSPTFALLLLFPKLYPQKTLREFLKEQFSAAIHGRRFLLLLAIQLLIAFVAAFAYAKASGTAMLSFVSASSCFVSFFDLLIRGSLGEELGWRGYALNKLQERRSPLLSAVLLGAVWGFWHAPLWFLTTGLSGMDLVLYIAAFLAAIIAMSIIMAFFYNSGKNILVPIVAHQLFNFLTGLSAENGAHSVYAVTPLYVLFALVLIVLNPNKLLYGKKA